MAPKSMSSEVENIELKGKENNTDKLNLSGQTARQPISHVFLTIYKHPMHRKLLSKTLFTSLHPDWKSPLHLCLRVPDGEFIDNSSVINYDQLYAQMMYELRDKQTPYWFTNDEVSCIQESLGAVFLEKVKGG